MQVLSKFLIQNIGFSLLVDPTWTLLGNVFMRDSSELNLKFLQWESMGCS